MGRYVHGTEGFTYKYVFAAQDTNLYALSSWAGLPSPTQTFTLGTQFFGRLQLEDAYKLITSVGWLTTVFEATIPPMDLSPDVEDAIDQVGDRWQEVICGIDEALPGAAISPDIAGGRTFRLRREDWGELAARIGYGANPNDPNTLSTAVERAWEDGREGFLPLLAANALRHAVKHNLDVLDLWDASQTRQTNLWLVVEDYAGSLAPAASWEERLLFARLYSFQHDSARAMPLYAELLKDRPDAINVLSYRFAHHIKENAWDKIEQEASALLEQVATDAARANALVWRGEARWCVAGDKEAARADAEAAASLGDEGLLWAMSYKAQR